MWISAFSDEGTLKNFEVASGVYNIHHNNAKEAEEFISNGWLGSDGFNFFISAFTEFGAYL